jgi:hypothetical protein
MAKKKRNPKKKGMTSRFFFRTIIEVEVLSEMPFEFTTLGDVDYLISKGYVAGDIRLATQDELTGKETADRLMELGHDPRMFSLTADGEDTAEERAAKTPVDSPQVRRTVRLLRDAIAASRTGRGHDKSPYQ